MATCDVYWKNIKVGSGTATQDSVTISSYTSLDIVSEERKRLRITATNGANAGETFTARCITDGGTSLTLDRPYGWAT
jgi:hypothetical protein